jgi:uncharacterized protein
MARQRATTEHRVFGTLAIKRHFAKSPPAVMIARACKNRRRATMEVAMPEHPNVQRIRDAYAALVEGDLPEALKDIAPTATFHIGGSGPLSGDRTGIESITSALVGVFELTAGTQKLDITSVYADDRHGIVVMRETASRPDGATLDLEEVHVLAIDDDGRITDLWDLPSDPEAHDRFFDGE